MATGSWMRKETPWSLIQQYVQLTNEELKHIFINSSLIFRVKTCNDANFRLGRSGPDTVVIGGKRNTKMWINGCEINHAHGILSCTEFRSFWFTFKNSTISVGRGEKVGERGLMNCSIRGNKAFGMYITTFIKNPGTWLFRKRTG
ncbi:uncharacterized protein LOC124269562 [Haliotis rubra]|uniref:uncharacterized protein LOC124269562 n=1 Tax=Haliotis rubra TaxID=36100 RepID=UPI001EE5CCB4|nr:uncharacterized protein LOC124269562 [Haliotis rubra]